MKVRHGFVSNSSSSSFCIYGANVDPDNIDETFLESNFAEIVEGLKEHWRYKGGDCKLPTTVAELKDQFTDDNHEFLELIGMEVYYVEYDGYYVGRSWSTIDDDETGRVFKQGVEEIISEAFPGTQCETYEMEYPC